jgi:hypothetical protein
MGMYILIGLFLSPAKKPAICDVCKIMLKMYFILFLSSPTTYCRMPYKHVVYYGLATTGLNVNFDQICSIGLNCFGQKTFYIDMTPTCDFHRKATKVNGMSHDSMTGELCLNDVPISDNTMRDGLADFLNFLLHEVCNNDPIRNSVLLVRLCVKRYLNWRPQCEIPTNVW